MATLSKGKTFGATETLTATKLHQLVDNGTVSGIQTADISDAQITAAKIAANAVETAKIKDDAVTIDKIGDNAVGKDQLGILTTKGDIIGYSTEPTRIGVGTNNYVLVADSTETNGFAWKDADTAGLAGKVVQLVNVQDGDYALGSNAQFPEDDSKPQVTEGFECMTLAITPTSATSRLKVDVVWNGASANVQGTCVALFNSDFAATDALACANNYIGGSDHPMSVSFSYYVTAGTTSETTFKVRAGNSIASTNVYFNGSSTGSIGRKYDGAFASSITITELSA